jgi:hypothetical protein
VAAHAAREVGIAPDALRRRNFIKPDAMPYQTAMAKTTILAISSRISRGRNERLLAGFYWLSRRQPDDSGSRRCLIRKPIISCAHSIFAVAPFQPAYDEMRSRHLLKVVDERVVHRRTAERANKRHGHAITAAIARLKRDLRNGGGDDEGPTAA